MLEGDTSLFGAIFERRVNAEGRETPSALNLLLALKLGVSANNSHSQVFLPRIKHFYFLLSDLTGGELTSRKRLH